MKIPHRDLEEARQNPAAYVKKLSRQGPRGFGPTLFRAWQYTIYGYHQNKDIIVAKNDLETRLKKFSSGPRQFDAYYEDFEGYVRDFERLNHIVVDTAVRLTIDLGSGVQISGEVSRVDVTPVGYSAVLIVSSKQVDWQEQLRMPLLQKNFAESFSVSPEKVQIGIFPIGGKHELVSYTPTDIAKAEKEARSVARRVIASSQT